MDIQFKSHTPTKLTPHYEHCAYMAFFDGMKRQKEAIVALVCQKPFDDEIKKELTTKIRGIIQKHEDRIKEKRLNKKWLS